jgi:protein-S-isoprenylcysteine O-methyltransferase Ste14
MPKRLDLPPVWALVAAAAIWFWAGAFRILPLPGWVATAGWLAILAGALFAGWAVLTMLRHKTPIEPRQTPRALVTDGPFRLTRNPIYRGLIVAVAGWTLVCGEATALTIAAVYAALLHRRFALPEEAMLAARFPEAFRHWAARTRWRL